MKGTLLDSNLLCLLAVGRADRRAIADHPRLRVFEEPDLGVLGAIIDRRGALVICPHVLTETSNLIGYRQSDQQQRRWRQSLAELVHMAEERSQTASRVVDDEAIRVWA